MRLWSIHPKYLDQKGLVACWREALGAKAALEGKVKGYRNHSQLIRFKNSRNPIIQINLYLYFLLQESLNRGYKFDSSKLNKFSLSHVNKIPVTEGQLNFEKTHFLKKIKIRDNQRYANLKDFSSFEPHPLFALVPGEIENWEKL